MALVTRARPGKPARTEGRYHPGDTPYPYRDCCRAVKQLGVASVLRHGRSDVEERLAAQVDLLRMSLETIAATWLDADGGGPTVSTLAGQRESDQKLARLALKHTRALDDDRQQLARSGRVRVGKR